MEVENHICLHFCYLFWPIFLTYFTYFIYFLYVLYLFILYCCCYVCVFRYLALEFTLLYLYNKNVIISNSYSDSDSYSKQ